MPPAHLSCASFTQAHHVQNWLPSPRLPLPSGGLPCLPSYQPYTPSPSPATPLCHWSSQMIHSTVAISRSDLLSRGHASCQASSSQPLLATPHTSTPLHLPGSSSWKSELKDPLCPPHPPSQQSHALPPWDQRLLSSSLGLIIFCLSAFLTQLGAS